MRLRKGNGQSCTRNEEVMINRSGIIENRGGGGIFPVLFLAGGDASHPSGMGKGDGGEGGGGAVARWCFNTIRTRRRRWESKFGTARFWSREVVFPL